VEVLFYAVFLSEGAIFYAINRRLMKGLTLRRIPPDRSSEGEHWEPAFAAAMSHSGLAPSTVRTYRQEVRYFVRWLEERTGTPVGLKTLAAIDLLSYRQHLINV